MDRAKRKREIQQALLETSLRVAEDEVSSFLVFKSFHQPFIISVRDILGVGAMGEATPIPNALSFFCGQIYWGNSTHALVDFNQFVYPERHAENVSRPKIVMLRSGEFFDHKNTGHEAFGLALKVDDLIGIVSQDCLVPVEYYNEMDSNLIIAYWKMRDNLQEHARYIEKYQQYEIFREISCSHLIQDRRFIDTKKSFGNEVM